MTEFLLIRCWDDKLPPNGRGQDQVTSFRKFCPNHIFGDGKTWHFKCRLLIYTEVY